MSFVKWWVKLVLALILLSTCYCIIPLDYCRNLTTYQDFLQMEIPRTFSGKIPDRGAMIKGMPTRVRQSIEMYDFIVVGSGPAGSVIANRLTENPKWKVLLLEVGEVPTNVTDIPAIANSFQTTDYNWGYTMEPQKSAGLGLVDGIMNLPRGRVLGGTSTINALIHMRGNRLNFDRWAAAGNTGWAFDDVLPYFKKSEDFLVKIQDPQYHNEGGYLGVQDVPYRSNSSQAFVDAMKEFGYDYVDYNGRQQIGVSFAHGTLRNGRRSSAYNAYLKPFQNRTNFNIYPGAKVTKILIDRCTKTAYGVQYDRNEESLTVKARKEIIVSAGAFASPQLLMLSGIGPREHLQDLNIDVITDLPVGQNLYDHVGLYGITYTINESITIPYSEISTNEKHMQDFLNGEGILTTLTGTEAFGIVKTPYTTDPNPTVPDVELIYIGASNNIDNGTAFKELVRVKDDIYDAIWGTIKNTTACTIVPMLYHPKSRGYLELRSNNSYDYPKFYGNFFTDPENDDIKVMISAVRMIQKLVKMPALQKYNATLVNMTVPDCMDIIYDTDKYWECALRHMGVSSNHQIGTCKMGPKSDPEAVVGPDLKVHGIRRLRVADTSIIPRPLAAHTNIPSFMIGEKAADVIKANWGMT